MRIIRSLFGLLLVLGATGLLFSNPAQAEMVTAQEEAEESPGAKETPAEDTKGAGEEGAAPEEGPPWTFQMARISLVLIVLLAGAVGSAYYRFVVRRARGEI